MKYYLKTKNGCLKIQTKYPLKAHTFETPKDTISLQNPGHTNLHIGFAICMI